MSVLYTNKTQDNVCCSVISISGEENDAHKTLQGTDKLRHWYNNVRSMAVLDRSSLKEETSEIALSQSGATSDQVELQEGKLLNA